MALTLSLFLLWAFKQFKIENINLQLGQSLKVDIVLLETTVALADVEVVGTKDAIFDGNRTGASNNISLETINALPTINRSINDFTRTTPQSNGNSFAGTSSRFNNYTIDGNIYNNNFGLGSGQFAGSNPISLDAIEEIQVNLAPYDVRLSGFTGASVNAITKSGTNEFSASAYYFLRNDQMVGDKVGDTKLPNDDAQNQITGFRVGGPIIKDKLFFFVNYEKEDEAVPSFTKRALRPGETPDGLTISRVPASLLQNVSDQLSSLYGYETGAFEGYSFASEQERFNVRLDYNISRDHKFSIRYNDYTAFNDVPTNGNSVRFVNPRFRNTSRTGIEAMNFRNTNYTNDRSVKSLVAELNSVLAPNISNQLNIGFTSVTDPKRGIPGEQAFPFIEVLEPDASNNLLYYFSVGNELYSVGNLLENNVFNITDNLTYFKGRHTITAGFNFEYMTFDNAFNPAFNGFYRFNTYQAFEDVVINKVPGVYPDGFAKGFALDGSTTPPTDQTKFGQIAIYGQDEFQVNDRLKLTGGLRIDLPFYPIDIPRNEVLDSFDKTFTDINGDTFTPDVSTFPKARPLFSPRVGVNWDVNGDKTTQVRGGTGIFTGRIPFVWLSNQVNGSGVVRGGYGYDNSTEFANAFGPNYVFDPSVTFGNPTNPQVTIEDNSDLNLTDENFKLPQVWRTNAAVDQALPFGILGTLELIYSRDVNTAFAYNAVLRDPDGTFNGPDQRPFYTPGTDYSSDANFENVFLLTNAREKADYYSITFQFQKQFDNGFFASAAYTRSRSRDLDASSGDQASSLWTSSVREDRNNPELGFAGFDIPHRVIANLSYQVANSSIGIFYEGSANGRFSYAYSGNFGDDSERLMYVPNDATELNFQEFTLNGQVVTAAQQAQLLDAYINQDEYLSEMRGKVVERNGAVRPWLNRFDLRLLQDINLTEDKMNKLQFSIDILNVGNLLKSTWGVSEFENQRTLLNYRGINGNNEPVYRLNTVPGTSNFPTETFRSSTSLGDTWRMQVGIRYIFN